MGRKNSYSELKKSIVCENFSKTPHPYQNLIIPWDVNSLSGLCYLTDMDKYEATSPLAKSPRPMSTVPFLKDTQSMQSWFPRLSVFICEACVILWLLSLSWLQQALAPALTSTSSPLGFSLNHFTTQVRPMWSPDCTTPYNPGSWELWAFGHNGGEENRQIRQRSTDFAQWLRLSAPGLSWLKPSICEWHDEKQFFLHSENCCQTRMVELELTGNFSFHRLCATQKTSQTITHQKWPHKTVSIYAKPAFLLPSLSVFCSPLLRVYPC